MALSRKKTGGGIICYIKNDIPYIVNGNIQANNDDFEIMCNPLRLKGNIKVILKT